MSVIDYNISEPVTSWEICERLEACNTDMKTLAGRCVILYKAGTEKRYHGCALDIDMGHLIGPDFMFFMRDELLSIKKSCGKPLIERATSEFNRYKAFPWRVMLVTPDIRLISDGLTEEEGYARLYVAVAENRFPISTLNFLR